MRQRNTIRTAFALRFCASMRLIQRCDRQSAEG